MFSCTMIVQNSEASCLLVKLNIPKNYYQFYDIQIGTNVLTFFGLIASTTFHNMAARMMH